MGAIILDWQLNVCANQNWEITRHCFYVFISVKESYQQKKLHISFFSEVQRKPTPAKTLEYGMPFVSS